MGFPQAEHIDEAKLVAAEVDDGTALLPVAPDSED
jgi:hypothetical protein